MLLFVHDAPPAKAQASLDRYQDCFQKMIDSGATDNTFMRRCLGLGDKVAPKTSATGDLEFLTKGDALETAEKGLGGIKECYANLLLATQDLGVTPEGVVDARLQVKPSGEVSTVKFESGSLADVALLACLKERLKAWAFPRTTMADPVTVALGLRFSVAAKRSPVAALTKGSPEISGPGYGLSSEDQISVFRKNVSSLRLCYDEQLKRQPSAAGNVAVDLLVNARGRVAKTAFRELSIGDPEFKTCITTAVKKWKFPKPRGGEPTLVKYPPFQFAPK